MASCNNLITIHFRNVTGPILLQVLREDFTLADFKKALKENSIYNYEYSFVCKGKILDIENETVFNNQKHLITDASNIFVGRRLRGGGGGLGVPFVDLNNTNGLQRHEWNFSARKWRQAGYGICLEGNCNNASCEAYQQQVIVNIGLTEFDFLKDVTANTSKCPICSKYIEPITCAFNNCHWRWKGIKQPQRGMPSEKVSADWQLADNAYHVFDENISGTTVWRELIIEAKRT